MNRVLVQLMLVIAVVMGTACVAAAQWTSVGSAGTVDEADLDEFETLTSQVRILSTAVLPATIVIRYNVVNVNGMSGGDGVAMTVRYRDNGGGARVVASLKQVNISTGVTTTLLTFDSDAFAASGGFQTRGVNDCSSGFDFFNNAYYVETTISKASSGASPALQALQAGITLC